MRKQILATIYSMGWQRDIPDIRDYHPEHEKIITLLKNSKAIKNAKVTLNNSVDLSDYCSPIENQGDIGSCTAHAGVGLIEYYENRAFRHFINASRIFLYKTTRNLLGWNGDTGAWLRTTMQAMILFGVPPERYLPYVESKYDEEPSSFCYSFASNYQTLSYYRLDSHNISGSRLLNRIKKFLHAGYPSMFGFTIYNFGNDKGELKFPGPDDPVQGGHAVIAIGYDDNRKIDKDKGALKIRNSWGKDWGEAGYGWLPYKYIEAGLAVDFWCLFKKEYVDTNRFE